MKKTSKKGFTLIELIVVVVIIGILMAAAVPMLTKAFGTKQWEVVYKDADGLTVRTEIIEGYEVEYDDGAVEIRNGRGELIRSMSVPTGQSVEIQQYDKKKANPYDY